MLYVATRKSILSALDSLDSEHLSTSDGAAGLAVAAARLFARRLGDGRVG